jgi:hypothetical protein
MDRQEDFRRLEAPADAFAPRTRARSRRGTGRPERGRAPEDPRTETLRAP